MHHRCRGDRPLPVDLAKTTCSTSNTGRWSRPSSARPSELPLAGQVVVITGAGGAIGAATAKAFAAAGAEVALLDVDDARRPKQGQGDRRHRACAIACDVTNDAVVRAAFDKIVETFGGVDIVVSNAGAAWQGRIGEVDEAMLRKSFELNFFAPSARRAGRGEDHAGAGHRRLPAVQRLEAGGQSRPEFRALRPAQGRDAVAGAAVRGRLRRRRHPLQRRQRRPHPLGPAHRRFHQGALARRAASPRRTT